jgi:hypothetical protein
MGESARTLMHHRGRERMDGRDGCYYCCELLVGQASDSGPSISYGRTNCNWNNSDL